MIALNGLWPMGGGQNGRRAKIGDVERKFSSLDQLELRAHNLLKQERLTESRE